MIKKNGLIISKLLIGFVSVISGIGSSSFFFLTSFQCYAKISHFQEALLDLLVYSSMYL